MMQYLHVRTYVVYFSKHQKALHTYGLHQNDASSDGWVNLAHTLLWFKIVSLRYQRLL